MNRLLLLLSFFCSVNVFAEKSKKIEIYIELKGWPEALEQQWQSAINELATSKKCYDHQGQDIADVQSEYCHAFKRFSSIEQLKPYQRKASKKKLLLSYDQKNPEITIVQAFRWDGKGLQRIRNSDSNYANRDKKEFIISWSFK